jgi:hypothetical protein
MALPSPFRLAFNEFLCPTCYGRAKADPPAHAARRLAEAEARLRRNRGGLPPPADDLEFEIVR